MIHIAGLDVEVNGCLRQRCAWCGVVLDDYDLRSIAVPVGQDPRPGTWQVGALVFSEGGVSYLVEPEEGDKLPDGACAALDPAVTL